MALTIQELSTQAFAPFGTVITRPARPDDASGPGWQWWGEIAQMEGGDRPYALGYLDLRPSSLRFDWAERHMQTDELIVPLKGDCLVYVGPADFLEEPARLPDLDRFQVFRVRPGQAVLLKKGVWHGAPLADRSPANALVILLHDTSKVDGYVQRFESTPVEIQPA